MSLGRWQPATIIVPPRVHAFLVELSEQNGTRIEEEMVRLCAEHMTDVEEE